MVALPPKGAPPHNGKAGPGTTVPGTTVPGTTVPGTTVPGEVPWKGSPWFILLANALTAMAYFASARIGHTFSLENRISLIWVPMGFAVAVLLLFGWRLFAGLVLGEFISLLWVGAPRSFITLGVLANPAEAALTALVLQKLVRFESQLNRIRDVIGLWVVGAPIGATASVLLGTAIIGWQGNPFTGNWSYWWIGDMMSVWIVTPVILGLSRLQLASLWRRPKEGTLLLAIFVITATCFLLPIGIKAGIPLAFLPFPAMVVMGLRGNPVGAALSGLAVASIAMWATLQGSGPFATIDHPFRIWTLWSFVAVGAFTTQLLAATMRERQSVEAALRDNQQKYKTVAETATDAIITLNKKERILFANRHTQKIFGYKPEEMIGRSLRDFMPDRFKKPDGSGITHFLNWDQTGTLSSGIELVGMAKGGHEIPLEVSLGFMRQEDGSALFTAVMRDTTDRKKVLRNLEQSRAELETLNRELEQRVTERTLALNQALEDAQSANRAKSQFLANMSHELRTPLNAILGFANLLTLETSLEKGQRDYLAIITRSGNHLLGLINEVLELSKVEAGSNPVRLSSFPIHHLLKDLEDMFQLPAREKQLGLRFSLDEPIPEYLVSDQGKLSQILINLLGNAIKFTARGEIEVAVGMRQFKERKALLTIEVRDTGVGIAERDLEEIFEPFRQTGDSLLGGEGTGLGLPISRKFARLLGGELVASSNLGKGSIFCLTIQVGVDDAPQENANTHKKRAIAMEPDQAPIRLLIVEDNHPSRLLLQKVLENLGFHVEVAKDGQQAIAIFQTRRPHLIWMDMRMPVMDGYQATRNIKSLPGGRETPIIALTASAFEEQRDTIMAAGCDDYLPKPIQNHQLVEMLMKHLGVRFVFAEDHAPISQENKPLAPLDPGAIAALPGEAFDRLKAFTVTFDSEETEAVIELCRRHDEGLAEALSGHLGEYNYQSLLDAIAGAEALRP